MNDENHPALVNGLDCHAMENIQAAINALYEAFPWCDSLEGHDYWEDVVKKLETKLRDGRL